MAGASAPLSKYERFHTRIATSGSRMRTARTSSSSWFRGGTQLRLRNIFDLPLSAADAARPSRWRRRMIALGSGEAHAHDLDRP